MSDLLLERGLARPYDGGTRESRFCAGVGGSDVGLPPSFTVDVGYWGEGTAS